MTQLPELIYKVADRSSWTEAEATGLFRGMPIDGRDGYIHLSSFDQLPETLRLHFAGQPDLVLVAVRSADLGPDLRWEPSRNGALFPHLYAPLALAAVAWTAPISVAADGGVDLPEAAR